MLNGVGAVKRKPNAIGMFIGIKELKRMAHGMNSPVSGWTAVATMDWARLISRTASALVLTSLEPVSWSDLFSLSFYLASSAYISLIYDCVLKALKGLAVARKASNRPQ